MAAAGDSRVIGPRTRIGVPEMRVGVPFPPVALEIMRSVATPSAFQSMINTGSTYRDQQAIDVGLAQILAPSKEEVIGLAIEQAQALTKIPENVFAVTKRNMRISSTANCELAERNFGNEIRAIWKSPELRNVIRKYVEAKL
jgi:enoyl-CoA hydratase